MDERGSQRRGSVEGKQGECASAAAPFIGGVAAPSGEGAAQRGPLPTPVHSERTDGGTEMRAG